MRPSTVSFFLVAVPALASLIQPAINPNGVLNAASYIAPGFANYGIAPGSLFLIFGNYLGPDTLVQATSYPLAGAAGLGRRAFETVPDGQIQLLRNSTWFRIFAAVVAARKSRMRRNCSRTENRCCGARIMPACSRPAPTHCV